MIVHYRICGPLQDSKRLRSPFPFEPQNRFLHDDEADQLDMSNYHISKHVWIAGYSRQRRPIIQLHSSLRPSQQNRKVLTRSLSFHALFEFASHICKEHTLPCTKPFSPSHHRPGFLLVPMLRLTVAHGRPKWASLCRGARLFRMSVGLVW
jgi:hypothetical protein